MLRTSFSVRQRAFLALTIALGLAYLLAALGLARPSQIADFWWPSRFNLGSSLVLVLGVLYGGAALLGRRVASSPRPPRARWRSAVCGVLVLLAIVVLVGGWNAGLEVLGDTSRSTTAAEFFRRLSDACTDYIGKPLAYIMPLGSLVAGSLGWWVGRRKAGTAA